jgi:MSHA biogenesis protein MshO
MKLRSFQLANRPDGFSLVELIVVIAIAGVIAGMVAVFVRRPIDAYVDTVRRAELTEAVDTAVRRVARDIRTALPNSVRVVAVGGSTYLEFIPTVGGGRYRQYPSLATGAGNVLDFNIADTDFDVLGPVPVYAAGNSVTVFNLGDLSASDAYAPIGNVRSNRSVLTSANAVAGLFSSDAAPHTLTFSAWQFPAPSPSARFHIVATPVTYRCVPVLATPALGVFQRYTGYAFATAQPTPPAVAPQLMAGNVAECDFDYNEVVASGAHTRTGLITLTLRLEDGGESARIVHQIHVQNAP